MIDFASVDPEAKYGYVKQRKSDLDQLSKLLPDGRLGDVLATLLVAERLRTQTQEFCLSGTPLPWDVAVSLAHNATGLKDARDQFLDEAEAAMKDI